MSAEARDCERRCGRRAVVDVHNLQRDEHLVLCMRCFVEQIKRWLYDAGAFQVSAVSFGRGH